MGNASRTARHSEKMNRRRAVKAARRVKYAALAGTSKKGKRRSGKMTAGHKHAHIMANCGNPGCKLCFGTSTMKPNITQPLVELGYAKDGIATVHNG